MFLPKTGAFCCFLPAEPSGLRGQNWSRALGGRPVSVTRTPQKWKSDVTSTPKMWKSDVTYTPKVKCDVFGCRLLPALDACPSPGSGCQTSTAPPCVFVAFFDQNRLFSALFLSLLLGGRSGSRWVQVGSGSSQGWLSPSPAASPGNSVFVCSEQPLA